MEYIVEIKKVDIANIDSKLALMGALCGLPSIYYAFSIKSGCVILVSFETFNLKKGKRKIKKELNRIINEV